MRDAAPVVIHFMALGFLALLPVLLVLSVIVAAVIMRPVRRAGRRAP